MISHLVWKTCSWFLAVGSLPCLHGELTCTRTHIKHVGFNVCFCFVWRTKQSGSFRQKKNCTLQGHCTSWITFRSWFVPYILPCLELIIVNVAIFDDTSLGADRWDHIAAKPLFNTLTAITLEGLVINQWNVSKAQKIIDFWIGPRASHAWRQRGKREQATRCSWANDCLIVFEKSFPWHIGHRLWVG